MAEIAPITPSNPIIGPRRIGRDDKQSREEQQPKQNHGNAQQETDGEPAQHIDERV